MRSYENILIQLLNVFLALIPNFVFPIVLGLDVYGSYVGLVASIFLISKLSESSFDTALMMDASGQAKYSLISIYSQMVPAKLVVGIALFLMISLLQNDGVKLNVLLLLVMQLLSATSISLLYALNIKNKILLFLLIANAMLLMFSGYFYFANVSVVFVITSMVFFNLLMFLSANLIVFFGYDGCQKYKLPSFKRLIGFVTQSLGSNFLNGGLVLITSFFYSGERLGLFKVATSIVQATTSFFPVNLKTILTIFIKNAGTNAEYKYFRNFIGISILLFLPAFFAPLVIKSLESIDLLSEVVAPLLKFEAQLFWMIPSLTMFFIVMLLEKALLAFYGLKQAILVSVISTTINFIVAILLIGVFEHGPELSYSLSCVVYLSIVYILNRKLLKNSSSEMLALCSLIIIYFLCLKVGALNMLIVNLCCQGILFVVLLNKLNIIRITEYKNTIKEKLI